MCISWTSFALTMGLRQSHLILSPSSFPCQKLRFCDSPCRSFLVMIKEALDSGEILPIAHSLDTSDQSPRVGPKTLSVYSGSLLHFHLLSSNASRGRANSY